MLPDTDFDFITGVNIINTTAPRLLELARNATTVLVGPSVVMSSVLFEQGADALAGSVVADPEKTRFAIKNGAGQFFGEALQMTMIERDRAEPLLPPLANRTDVSRETSVRERYRPR